MIIRLFSSKSEMAFLIHDAKLAKSFFFLQFVLILGETNNNVISTIGKKSIAICFTQKSL